MLRQEKTAIVKQNGESERSQAASETVLQDCRSVTKRMLKRLCSLLTGLPNRSRGSSAGDPIVLGECLLRFIKREPSIARMDKEPEQSSRFLGQRHCTSAGVLTEKLRAGRRLVARYAQNHSDAAPLLEPTVGRLDYALTQIYGITEVDALLGLEGSSAASYFQALGHMIRPPFAFARRSQHPGRDAPNASSLTGLRLESH